MSYAQGQTFDFVVAQGFGLSVHQTFEAGKNGGIYVSIDRFSPLVLTLIVIDLQMLVEMLKHLGSMLDGSAREDKSKTMIEAST